MSSTLIFMGLLVAMFAFLWVIGAPGRKVRQFLEDSAAEAKQKRLNRFGRHDAVQLKPFGWTPWIVVALVAGAIALYGAFKSVPQS